jgi:hypothetical protein
MLEQVTYSSCPLIESDLITVLLNEHINPLNNSSYYMPP